MKKNLLMIGLIALMGAGNISAAENKIFVTIKNELTDTNVNIEVDEGDTIKALKDLLQSTNGARIVYDKFKTGIGSAVFTETKSSGEFYEFKDAEQIPLFKKVTLYIWENEDSFKGWVADQKASQKKKEELKEDLAAISKKRADRFLKVLDDFRTQFNDAKDKGNSDAVDGVITSIDSEIQSINGAQELIEGDRESVLSEFNRLKGYAQKAQIELQEKELKKEEEKAKPLTEEEEAFVASLFEEEPAQAKQKESPQPASSKSTPALSKSVLKKPISKMTSREIAQLKYNDLSQKDQEEIFTMALFSGLEANRSAARKVFEQNGKTDWTKAMVNMKQDIHEEFKRLVGPMTSSSEGRAGSAAAKSPAKAIEKMTSKEIGALKYENLPSAQQEQLFEIALFSGLEDKRSVARKVIDAYRASKNMAKIDWNKQLSDILAG